MQIKTYEESVKKRFIQTLLYSQIAGLTSDVLCLAGPNCEDYCAMLEKYIVNGNHKIYSYEKEFAIYTNQLQKQYSNRKLKNKVVFRSGDIALASPKRIIDLDFCATLSTVETTIEKLFKAQKLSYLNAPKVLMFTVSNITYKAGSLEKLIAFLQILLNVRITLQQEIEMEYGRQFYLHCKSSKYIVKLFSYSDTSSMHTVQIIY